MRKSIFALFTVAVIGISFQITLTSSSNGRAFAANSGNTGAPGESTTCRSCHGAGFGTSVALLITDSNNVAVTSYIPGNVYNVAFTVNSSGANRYGFQLTALNSSNSGVNGFGLPAANTRLVTLGNGRQYAEHRGKSTTSAFSTEWTAPATGTGNVTFYGGGAAVNNNGTTSGDGGNTVNLTMSENTSVGLIERSLKDDFVIYPNPTKNLIKLENRSLQLNNSLVQLYDTNGKLVVSRKLDLNAGKVERISVSKLSKGAYFLKVISGDDSFEEKIIIQ